MKNIYFISDAHLGCKALEHRRMQERRLVRFLDDIKDKADAIYLLGDMFDFWFEYQEVVPKGYTRFLGKLSELTDSGIEVHYFTGNHDMWTNGYLHKECGVIIHEEPITIEIHNKIFYLAHGHKVKVKGVKISKYEQFMFWCFENKTLQRIARWFPSGLFMRFGFKWAKHSHVNHHINGTPEYLGDDKECFMLFAKDYLVSHPDVNYFIFGHRHIDVNKDITPESRLIILGQWYSLFTYARFDGNELTISHYLEGDKDNHARL
ncbi:MAG: UDP-2,3-diacylglucosamine diphosphatase [Prevotellaceae bacterium]|nr:UDP-2,3-diacylglucosamine diphosphatase [Candidatus Colivivens equi]